MLKGETVDKLRRPQKAPTEVITNEQLERLTYPVVGSPKLDGFRCTTADGQAYTSSMKLFQNDFVQQELAQPFYHGLDGELIVGDPKSPDAFHNTSGPVRRFNGKPDFKFYVFDSFKNKESIYYDRWLCNRPAEEGRIIVLEQKILRNPDDVLQYEADMLADGYEGAMIRSMTGKYKEGRCTFNEMNIFKRKPFVDIEAVIIGLEEAMENQNEKVMNELGLSKRSHKRENMIPKGTLGNFVLIHPLWKTSFRAAPGKGFTAEIKQKIWDNRQMCLGEIATVKYQKHGSRDAPRLPSVIKLRPMWDIGGI